MNFKSRFPWARLGRAVLFLLPALVILALFSYYPLLNLFWISLHNWGITDQGFVGLENYRQMLRDPYFFRSLAVTVQWVLVTVLPTLVLGLFVAYLLFQKIRARGLFRTIYFLPYVTSVVAAAMVWRWIYNVNNGIANRFLTTLGFSRLRWLQEWKGIFLIIGERLGIDVPAWLHGPSLALVAVGIVNIWMYVGYDIVIYLAGLGNIPSDLYEAARIDGANERQVFRYITVPLLWPTTFYLLIVSIIYAFRSLNLIYVMTDGAPLDTTLTFSLYMFRTFYRYTRAGYASALAFFLFAITLLLTIVQFRLLQARSTK